MATPSESITEPLYLLKHLSLVDFSKLDHLPESHAWPELKDQPVSLSSKPVPVVNLHDPDFLSDLASACKSWGVFIVTGHGFPSDTLQRMEFQSRLLFSLPADQKLKALRSADSFSGYGQARISDLYPKLMWSEGFTIAGSSEELAQKLWPDDQHLDFCHALEEYRREMTKLAEKLLTLVLESLNLPVDGVSCCMRSGAQSVIQLNSYPPCPSPDRAMGMAEHTDSSIFTILYQNFVTGLQVLCPDGGGWVTVPCVEEGLIVNVGDLLKVISNGRCNSVVHRAVVDKDRHRLSLVFIYGPPAEEKIEPVGLRDGEKPIYRAVTWPEYLGLKANLFTKALESIRALPKEE